MKQKNILTLIVLLSATLLSAQFRLSSEKEWYRVEQDEKKFSFGYYLGLNLMSFRVVPRTYENNNPDNGINQYGLVYLQQKNETGFSVGLIGKLKINDNIALKTEPGVHFGQRTLSFTNLANATTDTQIYQREVKSTYVDIPLLLNISGNRWVNTRPYVQGGFGYAYNLQSNEKKEDDNLAGVFRTTTHNFNWQAEMGIEIYFKRFKLTPSIKGIFFLNNELVPDKTGTNGYANSLESLNTRMFLFSLKFE